jgi:hypothetical protein
VLNTEHGSPDVAATLVGVDAAVVEFAAPSVVAGASDEAVAADTVVGEEVGAADDGDDEDDDDVLPHAASAAARVIADMPRASEVIRRRCMVGFLSGVTPVSGGRSGRSLAQS